MRYIKQQRVVELLTIYDCQTVEDALYVVNAQVSERDKINTDDWKRIQHSEWETDLNGNMICRNCRARAHRGGNGRQMPTNFCHACGAEMDGKK